MWEIWEESENDHLSLIWAGRGAVSERENSTPSTSYWYPVTLTDTTWGWHSSGNRSLVVISVTNINLVSLKMSCLVVIGIVGIFHLDIGLSWRMLRVRVSAWRRGGSHNQDTSWTGLGSAWNPIRNPERTKNWSPEKIRIQAAAQDEIKYKDDQKDKSNQWSRLPGADITSLSCGDCQLPEEFLVIGQMAVQGSVKCLRNTERNILLWLDPPSLVYCNIITSISYSLLMSRQAGSHSVLI